MVFPANDKVFVFAGFCAIKNLITLADTKWNYCFLLYYYNLR